MAVGCTPGDGACEAIPRASAARISIAASFGFSCSLVGFAISSISFFFSVPPECSLCAQIPISKQDQAKNWQDRESAWATLGGSLEMRRNEEPYATSI
jgi:hypothetical protein